MVAQRWENVLLQNRDKGYFVEIPSFSYLNYKIQMKIILVGVHNKPDTNPLCMFTKTGKLLQRVIDALPGVEFEKTNLFNIDHFPNNSDDMGMLARDWWWRVQLEPDDIIILLGAVVHKNFDYARGWPVLKFRHPAGVRSNENKDKYVDKMVKAIKQHVPH